MAAGSLMVRLCVAQEQIPGVVIRAAEPPKAQTAAINEAEGERHFDIDFKGGPPRQLVETIEKAARIPLNVIIPEEHEAFVLPPLKLRNVTVPQLFQAISVASTKSQLRQVSPGHNEHYTSSYGFKTAEQRSTANSIWYFFVSAPPLAPYRPPQPQCRFWQLEPYLEKLKVEDITTALETGWKMVVKGPPPSMKFHKDTKLLIVVGEPSQLSMVDDVLRELTPARKSSTNKAAGAGGPGVAVEKQ
jgi:hypothetical protein